MAGMNSSSGQAADRRLVQRLIANDNWAWAYVKDKIVDPLVAANVKGMRNMLAKGSIDADSVIGVVYEEFANQNWKALQNFRFECRFTSFMYWRVYAAVQRLVEKERLRVSGKGVKKKPHDKGGGGNILESIIPESIIPESEDGSTLESEDGSTLESEDGSTLESEDKQKDKRIIDLTVDDPNRNRGIVNGPDPNQVDPIEEILIQEAVAMGSRALAELWAKNPAYALVLLMRHDLGLSAKDVAVLLGYDTSNAVDQANLRAQKEMRKIRKALKSRETVAEGVSFYPSENF